MRDLSGRASGATSANVGLGATDSAGPFTRLRIERCRFEADGGLGGFGIQLSRASVEISDSDVFGSGRALSAFQFSNAQVRGCSLRSDSFLMEASGQAEIGLACSKLDGRNPTGLSTNFRYVHCYKDDYTPIVNGFGSSVQ